MQESFFKLYGSFTDTVNTTCYEMLEHTRYLSNSTHNLYQSFGLENMTPDVITYTMLVFFFSCHCVLLYAHSVNNNTKITGLQEEIDALHSVIKNKNKLLISLAEKNTTLLSDMLKFNRENTFVPSYNTGTTNLAHDYGYTRVTTNPDYGYNTTENTETKKRKRTEDVAKDAFYRFKLSQYLKSYNVKLPKTMRTVSGISVLAMLMQVPHSSVELLLERCWERLPTSKKQKFYEGSNCIGTDPTETIKKVPKRNTPRTTRNPNPVYDDTDSETETEKADEDYKSN
jgi:hypothetical protein